jgi:hypothetical protein
MPDRDREEIHFAENVNSVREDALRGQKEDQKQSIAEQGNVELKAENQ